MAENEKKQIVILSTSKEVFGFATVTITADEQDMAWLLRLAQEDIPVILGVPDLTSTDPSGTIESPVEDEIVNE